MKLKAAMLALLLLSAALTFAQDQDKDKRVKPKSEYAALLARVQGGDLTIDFQKLRFAWMDSPERHAAKDTTEQEHAMFAALKAKDYKKAVTNADVVLANEFVNMDAHFVEYASYGELHEEKKSQLQKDIFTGLVKSILSSGDGKTMPTAYVVIAAHEEYVVLEMLGFSPGTQSLMHDGAHSYDQLEVKDESGKTTKLYFNVDIPFKHYLD